MGTVIKIDLDIDSELIAIEQIRERIFFMDKIKILSKKNITKIELIYKKTYSCRIFYKHKIKDEKILILIQSILGDDWRRTAITLRDYLIGIQNFNRLFDVKKYVDGSYITATKKEIKI